jgi:hypothetical protein
MRPFTRFLAAVALPGVLTAGLWVSPASAQTKPDRRPAQLETSGSVMDAASTRRLLMEVLEKHPPSVARVLKLDPSLMRSESYLAAYPALRDFLAAHQEVPQNAQYYLEEIYWGGDYRPWNPQLQLMQGVLAGLAGFTAFSIVLGTLIWLIRTVLDQRRWNRLSKIQAEVHTKLMDRFSTNDELLSYVQTPSGRRFLESGPSPLVELGPGMAAPLSRILWSVQLGSILLVTGLGLLFLSGRPSWPEVREVFYFTGCIAAALGAGFLVSAAASYVLSRRLGLFDRPATNHA